VSGPGDPQVPPAGFLLMDYEIKTSRLLLRPITPEDVDELHRLWTNREVRRYIWDGVAISREEAAAIIGRSIDYFETNHYGLWAITISVEDCIIGFCGFWCFRDPPELELIYGLLPEYWGKGMATEAVRAIIRFGFDQLSLQWIVGSTDAVNAASCRVMERAGMRFADRAIAHGIDTIYYKVSRREFEKTG